MCNHYLGFFTGGHLDQELSVNKLSSLTNVLTTPAQYIFLI